MSSAYSLQRYLLLLLRCHHRSFYEYINKCFIEKKWIYLAFNNNIYWHEKEREFLKLAQTNRNKSILNILYYFKNNEILDCYYTEKDIF